MENNVVSVDTAVSAETTEQPTAIQKVETSLADFTAHNFGVIDEEFQFQRDLQNEIRARLSLPIDDGGFKNSELIALYSNNITNLNDRLSKSTGPISQLLVAKQQAEIAAKSAETKAAITINNGVANGMKQANETLPQDVILGAQSLNALLSALTDISKKGQTNLIEKETKSDETSQS